MSAEKAEPGKPISKKDNAPTAKLSVASMHCRICYDNDNPEELIAPCHCKVIDNGYNTVIILMYNIYK